MSVNITNTGCYWLKVGYVNKNSEGYGNSFTPITETFGQGGPSWGNGNDGSHPTIELFYPDGSILSATVFNGTSNPDFTGNFNAAPEHHEDTAVGCDPSQLTPTVTVISELDQVSAFNSMKTMIEEKNRGSIKGNPSAGFFAFIMEEGMMYGAYTSSGHEWTFSLITDPRTDQSEAYTMKIFTSLVNS